MQRFLTLVLFPVLLTSSLGQTPTREITLESARNVLSNRMLAIHGPTDALGAISLKAFDFSRELEVGGGLRVIAISCQRNGGLVAFHADGSLIQLMKTDPIISIQLVNMEEAVGISEIITEEVAGWGTGVLEKTFNLYVVSDKAITKTWSAQSYSFESSEKGPANVVTGFLRFDRSAFGENAKLTYVLTQGSGEILKRETYVMKSHHLVLLTSSSEKE